MKIPPLVFTKLYAVFTVTVTFSHELMFTNNKEKYLFKAPADKDTVGMCDDINYSYRDRSLNILSWFMIFSQ